MMKRREFITLARRRGGNVAAGGARAAGADAGYRPGASSIIHSRGAPCPGFLQGLKEEGLSTART